MLGQIRRISVKEARPLVEEYHYSKNLPAGKNICFGWFLKDGESEPTDLLGSERERERLYASAVYGLGSNPIIHNYLANITGLPVTSKNLYELRRLVRVGSKEEKQVSLSQMLSYCHRSLAKEDGTRYIVSYSDPEYNPSGGIYAASNFIKLGWTSADYDILDKDGTKLSRRTLIHWRNRNGHPTIEQACEILGYRKVKTPPKKRWFIALDPKDQKILKEKFPPPPKKDWLTELEEAA